MSRDMRNDFNEFISFFSNYNLKKVFDDKDILGKFSLIHKRYYSFMCLVYCIHHFSKDKIDENSMLRLRESSSDLGTAMFLIINGAYKPANLMMRSCIENFIKSVGCLIDASVLEEKSLYKVIDKSGEHPVLEKNRKFYDDLKTEYAVLCSHVHTATEKEMVHVNALNVFPTMMADKTQTLSAIIDKTIKSMIYITICIHPGLFFSLATEYRDKILDSLTASQRASLHTPQD